jgi:Rrf2 family protein
MAIINRETDYALRALRSLALAGQVVPVSALAEAEGVPELFLRKIMQRLHAAGIVESRQGPAGGYKLARPAVGISFLDVVEAVQGPLLVNECFGEPGVCRAAPDCPLRRRLAALQRELTGDLAGMSLAEVVRDSRQREGVKE